MTGTSPGVHPWHRLREWATAVYHRGMRTPVGRALHRFNHFRGTRLAGTVTFYAFLSVFPILVLAFAVALRVIGPGGVDQLEDFVEQYVPGLADQLGLQRLRSSAASLQVIGVATLLVVGLRWVDATRASVRSMWGLPDREGSWVAGTARDLVSLAGLGVLVAVSLAATTWVSGVSGAVLDRVGVVGPVGEAALEVVAYTLSGLTSALIVAYVVTGLPRIAIPWRVLLPAALAGGVSLEVLKRLLVGYVSGFATDSAYGAFGVPVALIVWIYVVARLVMVIAAWTAERCGAPLVQPRFIEAAAALRAAGEDESQVQAQDEAVAQAVRPIAERRAHQEGRRQGLVLGTLLGAVVVLLLRRQRR